MASRVSRSTRTLPLRVCVVLAATLAALLGALGADSGFGNEPLTVHLLDLSRSHGRADDLVTAFFLRMRAQQHRGQHALLGFANANRLLLPPLDHSEFLSDVSERSARVALQALPADFSVRTRFANALVSGLHLQQSAQPFLVVLHGDGRHAAADWSALSTSGAAFTHAGRLPGKAASAPTLALNGAPVLLVSDTQVDLPLLLHSDNAQPVEVVLSANGSRQLLTVAAGTTLVQLPVLVPRECVEVQLHMLGDTGPPRATLRLPVAPHAAMTLRVIGDEAPLRAAFPDAEVVQIEADLVVVNGVSVGQSMNAAALTAIVAQVRNAGCGLLLLGGPQAFGAGGWAESPLESIAPLMPARRAAQDFLVLIDASGSMDKDQRLRRALHACTVLSQSLGADDRQLVLPFTTKAGVPTPATPVAAAQWQEAARALDALVPSGGTALLPALEAAVQIRKDPQRARVLLILSDWDMADLGSVAALALAKTQAHAVAERVLAVVLDPQPATMAAATAVADEVQSVQNLAPETLLHAARQSAWKSEEFPVRGAGSGMAAFAFDADGWNPVVTATDAEVCAQDEARGALAALRQVGRGTVAAMAVRGSGAAWTAAVAAIGQRVARRSKPPLRILSGPEGTRAFSAEPLAQAALTLETSDGKRVSLRACNPCEFISVEAAPAGPAQLIDELGAVLARGFVVQSADEEMGWPAQELPAVGRIATENSARWPWAALAALLLAIGLALPRRVPFQSN